MKPNIYLVADKKNRRLAQELLQGNTYHITEMKTLGQRKEEYSGIIFIIIDEYPTKYLLSEIRRAYEIYCSSKKYSVFPIILDNAAVPSTLRTSFCRNLDTESLEEKRGLKAEINTYIQGGYKNDFYKIERTKEYSTNSKLSLISFLTAVFSIVVAIITLEIQGKMPIEAEAMSYVLPLLFVGSIVLAAITYIGIQDSGKKKDLEKETVEYRETLFSILDTAKDSENTEEAALKLMIFNLADINAFYRWSKTQAKGAFILAAVMCVIGLALIVAAAMSILIFDKSIEVATIMGLGGAMVEVIAGTVLVVYKNSLSQLNYYHKALHEDQRFLSSATLINRFSNNDAKDEALKEIIKSEIQINVETAKKEKSKEAVN